MGNDLLEQPEKDGEGIDDDDDDDDEHEAAGSDDELQREVDGVVLMIDNTT